MSTELLRRDHHLIEKMLKALEKSGMPKEGGPIARMLYVHKVTRKLAAKM